MFVNFPSIYVENDSLTDSALHRPVTVSVNLICIDSFSEYPDHQGDLIYTEISLFSGHSVIVTLCRDEVERIIKKNMDIFSAIERTIKSN